MMFIIGLSFFCFAGSYLVTSCALGGVSSSAIALNLSLAAVGLALMAGGFFRSRAQKAADTVANKKASHVCPYCHVNVTENSEICPLCGRKLEE